MEESAGPAVGPQPDHEHGVLVVEAEERVKRHHEAALGLVAAPGSRDRLELAAKVAPDRARMERFGTEAGELEPMDGLPHLADRTPFERERGRLDDRLVTVVERVQPVSAVQLEAALGGAEHRYPPVAGVRKGDETRNEAVERIR